MIIPSKKKAVSVIVSQFRPEPPMNEPMPHMAEGGEMESDPSEIAKKAIASDIIEALHAKSADDLMEALEAFFCECDREPSEEGPQSESDEM